MHLCHWHSDYCGFVMPEEYEDGIVWGLGDENLTLEAIGNECLTADRMPAEGEEQIDPDHEL